MKSSFGWQPQVKPLHLSRPHFCSGKQSRAISDDLFFNFLGLGFMFTSELWKLFIEKFQTLCVLLSQRQISLKRITNVHQIKRYSRTLVFVMSRHKSYSYSISFFFSRHHLSKQSSDAIHRKRGKWDPGLGGRPLFGGPAGQSWGSGAPHWALDSHT